MPTETKIQVPLYLVQDWTNKKGDLDSFSESKARAEARADELADSSVTEIVLELNLDAAVARHGFRHDEPLAVVSKLRSPEEIAVVEEELRQRIWYDLHLRSGAVGGLSAQMDDQIERARRLVQRRPDLGMAKNDLERTEWHAKLETLRWVMGGDWGNTDVS